MLLPHGMQGQGPEHSSCRIERFLGQSDEDPETIPPNLGTPEGEMRQLQTNNWQVVNVTTPANYFHVLRRQQHREFRKPLIVAATKALLRSPRAVSNLDEFGPATEFHRVYSESYPESLVAENDVRRVVFCSGKIYYELLEKRESEGVNDVAIIRLEQLSPFPFDRVASEMSRYPNADVTWCQEEPKNMGPWYFVQERFVTAARELNNDDKTVAHYIGRRTSSSPAVGYTDTHEYEQNTILTQAIVDTAIPSKRGV